ncbi:hypothetical protein AUJ17_03105 [Candidatus Micrarchaeota archaeon CG1_02_47_40]|nr:MAG: hypothetical protein AUJ17_03105 [Candidatus Micrarchaeota archaeon CG1_02_47_40]
MGEELGSAPKGEGMQNYMTAIAILAGAILVSASIFLAGAQISEKFTASSVALNAMIAELQNGQGTAQQGTEPEPSVPGIEKKQAPSVNLQGLTSKGGNGITIVTYSDFECPFCARAEPTISELMSKNPSLKVYFKQFPLPPQMHPNAQKSAEASLCAQDQGKFWEYHDKLFANQQALSVSDLKGYAKALGMDEAAFNACLDGGKKADIISAHQAEGALIGVSGTPAFYIIDSDATADVEGLKSFASSQNAGGRNYVTLFRDSSGKMSALVVGAQPISVFEGVVGYLS